MTAAYVPRHPAASRFIQARGLRHHLLVWGDLSLATPEQPLLVLMHGWMDVGASFQFVVDELRQRPGWADRPIVAIDWRGFGLSEPSGADSYWFMDYLADLDFLLDELAPGRQIDLLGHSMGGNATMLYAGLRPERIRRLVNVEGFGMPSAEPEEAPTRILKWMDELKTPQRLKDYATVAEVADRLKKTNPLLRDDFAQWLAGEWSRDEAGRRHINADAGHKRSQPLLYRLPEVLVFFRRITAPVLFVEGDQTLYFLFFNGKYDREQFVDRCSAVADFTMRTVKGAGHMLHHDQPGELAMLMAEFLRPA